MLKRWTCGAVLSVGMIILGGCASHSEVATQASGVLGIEPVTIISRTAGNAPALTEPGVLLINDATTLENLQCPQLTDIHVDFDTQSLVVLALGECPTGGYWAHIQGVQTLGDKVLVQSIANEPAADAQVTQAKTYPFEAVVVQKVHGTPVPRTTSVQGQEHPSDEVIQDQPAVAPADAAKANEAKPADSDKPAADQKPADQTDAAE